MKITDIRRQVKRADRYSVYIDGKYTFSFSENEVLKAGLKLGQEFEEQELSSLKDRAIMDKAYDQTLNLIMRRPRSEWELRDYLNRKSYEKHTIETILNMLSKRGYINDTDFARRWVENRRLLKATSKRKLTQELRQKRVSDETIQSVLGKDETDEQQVLRELIARKRNQTKYQDDTKLIQYLLRQGFNYGDIKTVLTENQATRH